jgi:integration host factor subunit beta
MNKLEPINELKDQCQISKKEAATIIDLFFGKISETLAEGDRVEIRGLCSFYVKDYPGYNGRNPKTGETVTVAPKKLPFFKCGKGLREQVDIKMTQCD